MFEGLDIWKDEKYQKLQGSFPVIFLSFANVKEKTYQSARERICQILVDLYAKNNFLREAGILGSQEADFFESVNMNMNDNIATMAIHKMCDFLQRYYGKRVIVLLDEYDTPMQEAYVEG